MPHARLTAPFVKNAKAEPGADRTIWWDENEEGFGLQVTANGAKSFVFQYRAAGVSRRMKLDGKFLRLEAERDAKNGGKHKPQRGLASALESARREAAKIKSALIDGRDPLAECRKAAGVTTNTLEAIAQDYMKRDGRKLRSHAERQRVLEKYVYPFSPTKHAPKLGSRQIDDIKRADVVRMLDHIEDAHGPVQADHVLAILRKLFNWCAARSDDFRSPLVKGMGRAASSKDRARTRILSDVELRTFWKAAETFPGAFGHLLRVILLTATRLREASNLTRLEVSGDVWTIPAERHKSKKAFELPLSKAAAQLLAAVPDIAGKGWVFTHDGKRPIGGFSKFKRQFDTAMLGELRKNDRKAELPGWVVHDLRRTARSLMSRAGVPADIAERCLGHKIAGVRGTYDRHEYSDERRDALERLADLVEQIILVCPTQLINARRPSLAIVPSGSSAPVT
jgi:integrase